MSSNCTSAAAAPQQQQPLGSSTGAPCRLHPRTRDVLGCAHNNDGPPADVHRRVQVGLAGGRLPSHVGPLNEVGAAAGWRVCVVVGVGMRVKVAEWVGRSADGKAALLCARSERRALLHATPSRLQHCKPRCRLRQAHCLRRAAPVRSHPNSRRQRSILSSFSSASSTSSLRSCAPGVCVSCLGKGLRPQPPAFDAGALPTELGLRGAQAWPGKVGACSVGARGGGGSTHAPAGTSAAWHLLWRTLGRGWPPCACAALPALPAAPERPSLQRQKDAEGREGGAADGG